jgi:hypothetical protein
MFTPSVLEKKNQQTNTQLIYSFSFISQFRPDESKERRRLQGVQLSETEKDVLLYSNMMERIKQDLKEDNMQV